MAAIPQAFAEQPEAAIASYDWTDIAQGTGYATFYAVDCSDGFFLTTNTVYSLSGSTSGTPINREFVTEFQRPMNVKGKSYIAVPIVLRNSFAEAQTVNFTVTPYIKKNTDILISGSGITFSSSVPASTGQVPKVLAWALDVPLTHFAVGDSLKLAISGSITQQQGSVVSCVLHDPKNRDITAIGANFITSQMSVDLPFRIQL